MPGIIWPQVTTDHEIIQLPCPLMLYLYNGILEKTIVEMSETDPPNHFSRIIQWPKKIIFGILSPFFHSYIFCHVVVSKVTSLTYLTFLYTILVCTKNVHCTKFQACPHFLPLQLMRLLFLICSHDQRMSKSTKEQKKVQDFPLLASAKCLYGLGKSGVAARLSTESET